MNDDFLSAIIRLLAIYVGVYLFMGACETFGYALTIGVVFGGLWLAERLIAWRRSLAVLRAGWSRARVWLANCAMLGLLCVAIALGVLNPAYAHDLGQWNGGDAAMRDWYQSLMRPDAPASSCCGEADAYFCDDYRMERGRAVCTITDDRPDGPRGRPHVDVGTVIEIPAGKLKWDRGNPTGRGVLFMNWQKYVFCYVQPGGA
jgi:hypothetical protein